MPVEPEAEKIRVAGDFILEKSKPKTIAVAKQIKPKGTYSQPKKKSKRRGLVTLNRNTNGKERHT